MTEKPKIQWGKQCACCDVINYRLTCQMDIIPRVPYITIVTTATIAVCDYGDVDHRAPSTDEHNISTKLCNVIIFPHQTILCGFIQSN